MREMRKIKGILFGCVLSSVACVTVAGDAKLGAEKAEVCFGCHGEEGNSEVPMFPKLAGQSARYIVKQIFDFQGGTRTEETMAGMAMMVENRADAQDIAAYFAKQKRMTGVPAEGDAIKLADKGKALYTKLTCITCHGESGEGKASLFPVIGGQHKDYLVKQLQDLRSGERKNDKTNLMAPLAKKMSDDQIEAVAEYMSSL